MRGGAGARHAAAQRATAQGAQRAAAQGRSVGLRSKRSSVWLSTEHIVGLRMGATSGRAGAPRLRNGCSVWLCGGAAWGCAGAQRGTTQGHRAELVPLSVCSSPLGCAASCWQSDRGEHWARQAQGAGREQRHLTPGCWCCPVPVPPGGGGGGGRLTPGYWRLPPLCVRRLEGGGGVSSPQVVGAPVAPVGSAGPPHPRLSVAPAVGGGGARSVGRRFPSF